MIKKVTVMFILFFVLSFPVYAADGSSDFFKESAEISGADNLDGYLPDETREYLEKNDINAKENGWILNASPKTVFSHIFDFIKSGAKTPFIAGGTILAVIIISAAVSANSEQNSSAQVSNYASVAASAAAISIPVFKTVSAASNALKGCAVFMTAFVPVFSAVVAASGKTVTSVSAGAVLIAIANVVDLVSSFVVIPLMSGYLTISIASSVSPILNKSGIADGIKKLSLWIMSLITTVYIGILSIQTTVASSADTLTTKTAKFVLCSTVPIAGSALSEALTTITASMGTIKATVGVYGIVACVAIFLPLLAELFLWRVMLVLCSSAADLFSVSKLSALLKSIDSAISVLIAILLMSAALFVISLSIIVSVGKV